MNRRCVALTFGALMGAVGANAQDTTLLEEITVEGAGAVGFYGEEYAGTTGGVMKTNIPLLETPRSVSVVTAQKIAEQGAQSVEQALSYSTGVVAGQWGLDNRSDWTNIRGFAPSTYHDGLQSRYGYYNDTKPETFLLDSVSVLRGPASALYGNGSVGGVVNTTSKVAGQDAPNLVQLQVSSHGKKQIGVDFSGVLNRSGTLEYRFVGLVRDSDTQVAHSRDDSLAFAPSLTWRPTDDTTITALLNYQNTRSSPLIQFASQWGTLEPAPNGRFLPGSLFVGEPGFDRFDSEQRALTLMAEHRLNDVWSLEATARLARGKANYRHAWWAFDNFDNFRYNADGTINRTFYRADNDMKSINLDVHATADWHLGNAGMSTLIGLAHTRGVYDSDYGYGAQIAPLDPFNPVYSGYPDVTVTDFNANTVEETGVYLQNRATLYDRLHLDFGLRWGKIETGESSGTFTASTINASDTALSKNLALLYRFDNGVAPYVSYAESFTQDVVGTDVNGNPFVPTRGEQVEIGARWEPEGGNTLLGFAAFDLTKSKLTVADTDNPGFSVQTGEARARGLELEARHRFGDFTVEANYTLQETENASGARIATVPDRFGTLWLGYKPQAGATAGWKAGFGARQRGAVWDGADSTRTPGFALYDAMVGYETEAYDLTLNVRNLADTSYVTFCGSGACYIGEERTVNLTLSAKF